MSIEEHSLDNPKKAQPSLEKQNVVASPAGARSYKTALPVPWRDPGRDKSGPYISPLWLCLLIALAVRVWLVVHTNGVIDGDEALVGIQAERLLHGNFPAYFYGQPYMGSLEVYLIAIIFALVGPSVWALRAEPVILSMLVVWLTWKLAAAFADAAHLPPYARQYFMTIAALTAAILPLYDVVIETRTYGGYIETFVLMLLLLLSAFHLTRRWFGGASYTELAWRWAGTGLLIGLGLWIYPLIAPAILAVGLWIAMKCVGEIVSRRAVASRSRPRPVPTPHPQGDASVPSPLNPTPAPTDKALVPAISSISGLLKELLLALAAIPAAIPGFTPALIWGATHQWANVAYILNLGGGGISRHRLGLILKVTQSYATCVAPRIISGAVPLENSMLTALHWPLVFFGTFCIFATVGLIALSYMWRRPALVRVRQLAGLPTLFAASTALAFCTSSASVFSLLGCTNDDAGRYATPFMLSLPFFFATMFTVASMYLYAQHEQREQRERAAQAREHTDNSPRPFSSGTPSRLTLLGQGLLLVLLLAYLGTQTWTYSLTDAGHTYQSNYCTAGPANNDPIVAYLQQQHIRYFWASNLLAYPLVFKANNSIIGADPLPLIHPRIAINRIPSYTDAVLHADRPTMLVLIRHNDAYPLLLRLLDNRNVTYQKAIFPSEPGFDILVVTPLSRTVSPLESKDFDIFYCAPR
ncbi:MAG: hypothetical protein NVSMB27_18450 [Ktedonobacteraceae bacterium]